MGYQKCAKMYLIGDKEVLCVATVIVATTMVETEGSNSDSGSADTWRSLVLQMLLMPSKGSGRLLEWKICVDSAEVICTKTVISTEDSVAEKSSLITCDGLKDPMLVSFRALSVPVLGCEVQVW